MLYMRNNWDIANQLYFNNFFLNERKKWKMIVGGGHQEDMYVDWPVNQIWAFETLQAFPGPWNVYLAYCSHS